VVTYGKKEWWRKDEEERWGWGGVLSMCSWVANAIPFLHGIIKNLKNHLNNFTHYQKITRK
jgi:hypothetical protein